MSDESLLEKVVNAHRYFSKFTPEQQAILEKLIEFTDDGGFNILGDVKGDVNGDISGDIYGTVYGNVEGDVKGDVMGEINVLGGDYNRRLVEMELAIKHLTESKDALYKEINGKDGLEERVHNAECSIRTLEDDSNDIQWEIWDIKETIAVR